MSPNINVIMGPTFSGKSTVLKNIMKNNPQYHRIITTTTRPPRANEENGRDYYFVTNRQALLDKNNHLQIAPRSYQVANHNIWTYYLSANNLKNLAINNFLIIDYQGFIELKKYLNQHSELNINLFGYLLNTDLKTIFKRIANSSRQNENPKETLRRLYDDTFNAFNLTSKTMQENNIQLISSQKLINIFRKQEY